MSLGTEGREPWPQIAGRVVMPLTKMGNTGLGVGEAYRVLGGTWFYVGVTYHYLARTESGWGLDPVSFLPDWASFKRPCVPQTERCWVLGPWPPFSLATFIHNLWDGWSTWNCFRVHVQRTSCSLRITSDGSPPVVCFLGTVQIWV